MCVGFSRTSFILLVLGLLTLPLFWHGELALEIQLTRICVQIFFYVSFEFSIFPLIFVQIGALLITEIPVVVDILFFPSSLM